MSNDNISSKLAKVIKIFKKRRRSDEDITTLMNIILCIENLQSYTANLATHQLRSLCEAMKFFKLEEDKYLFHKGESSDSFYIILSGEV